jgi:hypothetical protein
MTGPASVRKADDSVNHSIRILEDSQGFLQQQVSTVTTLAGEVQANFQTTAASGPSASATFQNKVQEWLDTANGVVKQFESLADDLRASSSTMDAGADNATQSVSSWGSAASSATFNALTGAS